MGRGISTDMMPSSRKRWINLPGRYRSSACVDGPSPGRFRTALHWEPCRRRRSVNADRNFPKGDYLSDSDSLSLRRRDVRGAGDASPADGGRNDSKSGCAPKPDGVLALAAAAAPEPANSGAADDPLAGDAAAELVVETAVEASGAVANESSAPSATGAAKSATCRTPAPVASCAGTVWTGDALHAPPGAKLRGAVLLK
ncbi:hypothetical protein QF001_000437 [Paraburkholderia youngii]